MEGQFALGPQIAAVIFEADGVVVDSARASAGAWKSVFDPFLRSCAAAGDLGSQPFEVRGDYLRYLYGREPFEGAGAFLASRRIAATGDELRALAVRYEKLLLAEIGRYGVNPFASAVAAARAARRHRVHTAAVSAQRHAAEMLRRAGVAELFDVRLDASVSHSRPARRSSGVADATELLLDAARRLGGGPFAVIAGTPTMVAAAHGGGFGLVIGVDRFGQAAALRDSGAEPIVPDLSELQVHGTRAA